MAVSVPGPVKRGNGQFSSHPSPGWQGFDIAAYLDGALRRPVFIDNDANMATVGELKYWRTNGKSAGSENWLVFKMNDSGIGAGIVSNGLVHRGATGLAGEIANIKMSWMSGIDVAKTRNIAFMLSGLGASIAGVMISSVRYGGDPVAGQVYVLKSIAAVVVGGTALTGGTGGPVNTLFGTLLMSVLDNGMNVVGIDPYFQQSILGFMIIVSVVLTFERSKTQMIK